MPVENESSAILLARMHDAADRMHSILINRGAVERLAKALDSVENGKPVRKNVTFARITREMLEEINVIRELQGKNPLVSRNVIAFAGAINGHLTKHIKEYGSVENIAKVAFEVLISSDTLVLPANYKEGNKGSLLVKQKTERFADSVVIGDTRNGKTSLKSISPRSTREIKKLSKERDRMLGRRLGRGENYPTSDTD